MKRVGKFAPLLGVPLITIPIVTTTSCSKFNPNYEMYLPYNEYDSDIHYLMIKAGDVDKKSICYGPEDEIKSAYFYFRTKEVKEYSTVKYYGEGKTQFEKAKLI